MFSLRSLAAALASLSLTQLAAAQTVVNSTYLGQCQAAYSDPNCWNPPEVPANTAAKQYAVTIPEHETISFDISATISNLNLTGSAYIWGVDFTVAGTTDVPVDDFFHVIIGSGGGSAATSFNAGTLSTYSAHTLRGRHSISADGAVPATFQFNGADIRVLSEGSLSLAGALARVTDEFGNDGLRNLARIDSTGELSLLGHNLTTTIPFTNDGTLNLGFASTPTTFAATGGLTNFDSTDRTLRGGRFIVGYAFGPVAPVEVRFNGADIVNNASFLELGGVGSRIADLAGNDGLRNLAHNLPGASLRFRVRDFVTLGSFNNEGRLLLERSTFSVAGSLANFDPASRTLNGGTFELIDNAVLRFNGADIVRNAATLTLVRNSRITDQAGTANGLRNFSENLSAGTFTVGPAQTFISTGEFTNAGRIETGMNQGGIPELPHGKGTFAVASGFSYTQMAGTTVNGGALEAATVNILGGMLSTSGSIKGNLIVSNAVVVPGEQFLQAALLDGDLTLNAGSHLRIEIGIRNEVNTWKTITGKVALGGNLDVVISDQTFLGSNAVVTLLHSDGPITGAFDNAPDRARVATADGRGSFVVVYEPNGIKLTQFKANPPPAHLFNISSRAFLSASGDDPFHNRAVLIGGFIITGTEPKKVALRGMGPSLAKFGVAPVLENPVLQLHGTSGAVILANDDWKETQATEIMQSQLAPEDDRESVIITTLLPAAYTVVLKEKNGLAGNGLVEVYDLSQNDTSKLANISTRGFTDSTDVLIGGIIAGGGQVNAEVVVRALGPQLRRMGLFNALEDPTLELRDNNGAVVAFNDNWISHSEDFLPIYELAPAFSAESGMRLSLPGGNYTAIVRPKGEIGGVALVEIYDLRR